MTQDTSKVKCYGNSVGPSEFFIHPITLEIGRNKSHTEHVCPSDLHYVDGKPYYHVIKKETQYTKKDLQQFMATPYLNLSIETLLKIYKIDNIDSMIEWIDNNININKPFVYINRIFNVWIQHNIDDLKKNNKILVSIYKKLGSKYKLTIKDNIEENIKKMLNSDNNINFAEIIYFNLENGI